MVTNTSSLTEVLHSENHSKLSAEEIAKAVAPQSGSLRRATPGCFRKGEKSHQALRTTGPAARPAPVFSQPECTGNGLSTESVSE